MKNKVIGILKSENDGIEDLATRIDSWYSGDMKQCMYCEKTVEYSSGVFTCEECSSKQPEKVSTEGWTRDTLLDVVKSSMRSTDFSAEYIVDAIISISYPDSFARLKEQSAKSAHTISEHGIIRLLERYKSTPPGTMSEHEAVHAVVDYVNSHYPTAIKELNKKP